MGTFYGHTRIIRKWHIPVPCRLRRILIGRETKRNSNEGRHEGRSMHTLFWKIQVPRSRLGSEGEFLLFRQQTTVEGLWTGEVIKSVFSCFFTLTGEGNGNPLQYSCLENPVDRGAWWAAIYGVTELDMTGLGSSSSFMLTCKQLSFLSGLRFHTVN